MSSNLNAILKSKAINKWGLFLLISLPISMLIALEMRGTDLYTGAGVSHMIGYSVRFAVPLIFLVVAASAVQTLVPGPFSNWWLRNRKYIGLSFAVAMAWQGAFIFIMSFFFRDYYYEDVYLLRDELEGSVGYIFLLALVLTSFRFGRKYLSQRQWKTLHTAAVYFLWAYPFSTYWWAVAGYYEKLEPFDYVFYVAGFTAFALRIAAWGKKRDRSPSPALILLGAAIVAFGLVVAATANYWRVPVSDFLTAPQWSADLNLWLPYWPFEPFIALIIVGFGVLLMTQAKEKSAKL